VKTGLCGGTFDPLHNGHVAIVRAALASGLVDRVIVMPAGSPPHKQNEPVSAAAYRYEMAVRAFASDPAVTVSEREILRAGPSYTLLTVRELRQTQAAEDELMLIYGSDVVHDLEQWHEPAALLAACPLLLADRGGVAGRQSRSQADLLTQRYGARIRFFQAPALELSSSWIRQEVGQGRQVGAYVPSAVDRLIERHGLYRHLADLAALTPDLRRRLSDLERQLWPVLSRKRLLHSLNVMNYAIHLARVHGLDPEPAALAGLLHDCAKCHPLDEQIRLARLAGDPTLLSPPLAHGPAGSLFAARRFGVTDAAILRAILCHTTGCAGMTPLDQILFLADKVEPARTYDNLAEIRRLAERDLDQAMLLCLREIGCFLEREHLPAHPGTQLALAELLDRLENAPSAPA
jgi:nicotinate-nucleotide adenylyltransferase